MASFLTLWMRAFCFVWSKPVVVRVGHFCLVNM